MFNFNFSLVFPAFISSAFFYIGRLPIRIFDLPFQVLHQPAIYPIGQRFCLSLFRDWPADPIRGTIDPHIDNPAPLLPGKSSCSRPISLANPVPAPHHQIIIT